MNRAGRFFVPDHHVTAITPALLAIMSRVAVYFCAHDFAKHEFEYCAYSEEFDDVSPGGLVPEYRVTISGGANGEELVPHFTRKGHI
jgi:hypothetical protein